MFLIVDSTGERMKLILAKNRDRFFVKEISLAGRKTDCLLLEMDKFLKNKKANPKSLSGLAAITGPGGFTNLRIAIAAINGLGYALNLPTAGLSKAEFTDTEDLIEKIERLLKRSKNFQLIVPDYGREPNIGGSG